MFDYRIINSDIESASAVLSRIISTNKRFTFYVRQRLPLDKEKDDIRVMSYNIRMSPHVEDVLNENEWKHRLPKIKMILNFYEPSIIGLQEISLLQKNTLKGSLFKHYIFISVFPTREPFESGLSIAYDAQKIERISDVRTIWLNESMSNADAACWDGSARERYIIYGKFKDKITDKQFWFLTTHFDHLGIQARAESAKIVINLANNLHLDAPVIITGDFNCFPQLGGDELYAYLSTYSPIIKDSALKAQNSFGVPGSWIGWDYDQYRQVEGYAKYDYIFTSDTVTVKQHGIIDDWVWDNDYRKFIYPSDHRPVLSDIKL